MIVCKKSAVPKTFLRLICSQLYIVWMKYCKYSPFYCERVKHEKVRHSLEIGNVCFQSKSCTLPLQPTHFKWNLYFQTASDFSVIHHCLMSSLLVFAAKFMSAMQATGDPSNLLAIKAIEGCFDVAPNTPVHSILRRLTTVTTRQSVTEYTCMQVSERLAWRGIWQSNSQQLPPTTQNHWSWGKLCILQPVVATWSLTSL